MGGLARLDVVLEDLELLCEARVPVLQLGQGEARIGRHLVSPNHSKSGVARESALMARPRACTLACYHPFVNDPTSRLLTE